MGRYNIDEKLTNLQNALTSFKNVGLITLRRLSECQFFMKKVGFLWHEISLEGVELVIKKTEALERFAKLTGLQFLGLASHSRKLVYGNEQQVALKTLIRPKIEKESARWSIQVEQILNELRSQRCDFHEKARSLQDMRFRS